MQTLEAAGYGEYIVGRGGKSTRIEVNEDFQELVREDQGIQEEAPSTTNDNTDEEGKEQPELESEELSQELQTIVGGTEVHIDIQISSEDWSSEEVIEFIKSLQDSGD